VQGVESTSQSDSIRGTQSFVHTMAACWKRPSLSALEVAWRWLFGIPAVALIWFHTAQLVRQSGVDFRVLRGISLIDPTGSAAIVAQLWNTLRPGMTRLALWIVPTLLIAWILVSAAGRTLVLLRTERSLRARPGTLAVLHGLRAVALIGCYTLWFTLVRWAGQVAIASPIEAGREPNAVLYGAMVIAASLGLFTLWASLSWVFSMAPLLAMLRGTGPMASLLGTFRIGAMRGKLVEINLVMGIVKLALIVLAMVASASPLPLQTIVTPEFMIWWYLGVTVVYFAASDFFHVVGLAAYLEIWQVYQK
jgi:hypothetical protein